MLITWEHFFKSEVRSSGRALLTKGKLTQSRPSDTEVQTYVRISSAVKVILKTPSLSSPVVFAICSCPPFKKGQFCKHIWAALLECENKHPDFLEDKKDLHLKMPLLEEASKTSLNKKPAEDQKRAAFQEALKEKQADYRKQQYQKQKQRLKEQKNAKKGIVDESYPEPVEKALTYFSLNGFPLRESMTEEAISLAKKKLSRVFHPDFGGSHEEIIELNSHAEILKKFAR